MKLLMPKSKAEAQANKKKPLVLFNLEIEYYLRVFRRKWNEPRREGLTVVRATPTVVQVEGSTTWYDLNRCTRVPRLRPRRREEQPEIDEGDEQIELAERE